MSRPLDCICVCIYIIDKLPRFVDASVVHKRRQTRCLRQGGWTVVGHSGYCDIIDVQHSTVCPDTAPIFRENIKQCFRGNTWIAAGTQSRLDRVDTLHIAWMGKWNMHYYAFLCKTGPRVNYNVGLLYVRSCNVEKNNDDMMVRSFADGWQYGMVYLYHVNSTMPKQWRIKSIVNINTTRASMLISFARSAVCSLSSLATLLYYCIVDVQKYP